MAESLRFDLLANDRASAVFDKVSKSASDTESKFSKVGRGLATVGKVAATGLAVGVGAGAVALGKFVSEARESERVVKLTESIIKSTGGAAKVTAQDVGNLATSISNKTGVDDEAIQSGSNLLLTFKNVRNEVGKGNKIFDEATQAAVDLSAAGFGSIEGSSKMLGKALNDPIAGISALGRAGVTFSEDQKVAIKAMVESGDTLGAQNAILAEVQGQVGGAAAATGTAMDKMKTSFGNLGETIGASLLPLVDKGAAVGAKFIGGLQSAFQSGGLGAALSYVGQQIGVMLPVIQAKLMEWGKAFVDWIGPRIPPMLAKLGELAGRFFAWAGAALPRLAAKVAEWGEAFVAWIGPRIPGMLAKLQELSNRLFAWVGANLPKLVEKLTQWGEALLRWIGPMIPPMLAELAKLMARLVGWVLSEGLPMVVKALTRLGVAALGGLKDGAVDGFQSVLSWLGGLPGKIIAGIGNVSTLLYSVGQNLVQGMINGIKSLAGQVAATARQMAADAVNAIKSAIKIGSPSKVTYQLGEFFGQGFEGGIKARTKAVTAAVGDLAKKSMEKLQGLKSQARAITSGVADAMRGALDVGGLGSTNEDGTKNSVTDQLAGFAAQAGSFASALASAAGKGLNSGLIQKIAQMGPTQGLTAAQALAAMDQAQVASANASLATVDKYAQQLGQTVLTTTSLPGDIAREQAKSDALIAALKDLRNSPQSVTINVEGGDPDKIVAAIRQYIKRNGKLRDVAAN